MAVLLPSRGKPEELARIVVELLGTATVTPDLYVYVADDDPRLRSYKELGTLIDIEYGPRLFFCDAINHLATRAVGADLLFVCSDDFHFVGQGWDEVYRRHVPADGLGMIFCDAAPFDGRDLPFTACVTRSWYEALGYVLLPTLHHMYGDNAMQDLARGAQCEVRIADRGLVEHHWNMQDERRRQPGYYPSERADWNAYMDYQGSDAFMQDVVRLRRWRREHAITERA